MPEPKPVTFENFQRAIAASPIAGFGDMRNIDIHSRKGLARLNFLLQRMNPSQVVATFTADAATDLITVAAQIASPGAGRAVVFTTTGTLPAGLSLATTYFLGTSTPNTIFKVYDTYDNAINGGATGLVNITDAGTGTHTITTTEMSLVRSFAYYPRSGTYYAQDDGGRIWELVGNLWYLIVGNTLTGASGNGIVVWKDYLIVFRDAKIDVYGNLLTAAHSARAWTNDWQSIAAESGNLHSPIVHSLNDVIYFAYKDTTTKIPYISSIAENAAPFAPGTAGSYTYTATAKKFPQYKNINCLVEYGIYVAAGTDYEIYPWDRSSPLFDDLILPPENGVTAMCVIGTVLYFACGVRGNIYATIGSATKLVQEFPASISGIPYTPINIPVMIKHKGRLFFTVECIGCSGVYSIDLQTGAFVLENRISVGTYGTAAHKLPAMVSVGIQQYYLGWKNTDAITYGIDTFTLSGADYYFQTSYGGYFETQMVEVGTTLVPRQLTQAGFNLTRPLATGQGVRLSYRTSLADSYTVLGTYDYATLGAVKSHVATADIPATEMVQIKVELTAPSSATTTPELRSVFIV